MNKGLVRRSSFRSVIINDALTQSVIVEGDEAYISIMISNGNSANIRRQAERDLKVAIVASGVTATNPSLSEFLNVDYSYGRVPLDAPATAATLQNMQITTTAGVTAVGERIRNANVGIKEVIDIKANNTTYPLNVLIETVHYVPAEAIAA